MLDTWRGALATRLSQALALPDVPPDVGQAFTEVWRLAMAQAGSLVSMSTLFDGPLISMFEGRPA